jgi:membrane protease YdiL (CAAX protease family)
MIIFIRAKISAITNGVESIEGLALLQFLMISLCETTFFFGYSQPRLSSRFGPTTGWLISAAFFTLWQVIPLSLHGAFGQDAIYQVLLATVTA